MNPYLAVQVDWNNDGNFYEPNNDLTLSVLNKPPLSLTRGNDQIQDLSPPMAGIFTCYLDNRNRKYSIANSNSPLFNNLVPGHPIRIKLDFIIPNFTPTATGNSRYNLNLLPNPPTTDVNNGVITSGNTIATAVYDSIGVSDNPVVSLQGSNVLKISTSDVAKATDVPTVSGYKIINGDSLYFDVLWQSARDFASIDILFSDGTYLSSFTANDQNGFSIEAATDISSQTFPSSVPTFYTRKVILPATVVGKYIQNVQISYHNSNVLAGDVNVQVNPIFQNIAIINNVGQYAQGLVTVFFSCPWSQDSSRAINNVKGPNIVDLSQHNYLYQAYLDDIEQNPEREAQNVQLPSLGALSKLKGKLISTQVYQNITTDQALVNIFNAIGLTTSQYNILDTGATTLTWWWLNNEDAFAAAQALLYSEGPGGKLFEDAQGKITFHSRHYRLTNAGSTTSQATFRDLGTEPTYVRPFSYDPGLKDIVNSATLTIKTRSAKASGQVWSYGTASIVFAAGQTLQFAASASDPFINAIIPVSGTDFTVVSGSITTVTLSQTSGQNVIISITAGNLGATINNLQLRAQIVSVDNTYNIPNTVDTISSQNIYGFRTYTLPVRSEIAYNDAQDLTNAIVTIYSAPRPIVSFSIVNVFYQRLLQTINRLISDRITIIEKNTGLNDDFWIEQIQISTQNGIFTTMFGAEHVWTQTFGVWGTAIWGTTVFGF